MRYITRSPDLFKIGRTRRTIDRRNSGHWLGGFRKVASYHKQRGESRYEPHVGHKQNMKGLTSGSATALKDLVVF